ncbi:hypothetical protein [Streptomyces sp. NPDC002763]|uniref:hypothetical protein n=1 Tax=Streptomyces sp. NPDC002763 TaxID=3154427 RepID=UPI00331FDEE4
MAREKKSGDGGPVNSFGIGSGGDALFRGGTWTPWSSVFVGLIGAAGLWLGVTLEQWVIVAFSGAVTLVAGLWIRASVRSHRDARRLERRAARDTGR